MDNFRGSWLQSLVISCHKVLQKHGFSEAQWGVQIFSSATSEMGGEEPAQRAAHRHLQGRILWPASRPAQRAALTDTRTAVVCGREGDGRRPLTDTRTAVVCTKRARRSQTVYSGQRPALACAHTRGRVAHGAAGLRAFTPRLGGVSFTVKCAGGALHRCHGCARAWSCAHTG